MDNRIVIRDITLDDIDELVMLYDTIWPNVNYDKMGKVSFILRSPNGINICAISDGRIIGSRTSLSMNLHYHDTPITCIQYTDSCILKEFRRQGIFHKLNQYSLNQFFRDGDLIFNISEPASRMSHEKLGWSYINSFVSIFKITNLPSTLLNVNFNIRKLTNNRIWDTDQANFEAISQQLLSSRNDNLHKRLFIKYDNNTLKWRFSSQSGIKVFSSEHGCIIFKIGHIDNTNVRIALIGEIMLHVYDKITVQNIIEKFIRTYHIDILQTYVTIGHPLYKLYRQIGFIHNPKHKFLNFGFRTNKEELHKTGINPMNWGLCTIDLDTF